MSAKLLNGRFPQQDALDLSVNVLGSGAVRVGVREHQSRYPRWEAGKDILQTDAMVPFSGLRWTKSETGVKANFGLNEVAVTFKPFTVTLLVNGQKSVVVNNENLFTFEQYRDKNPKPSVAEGEEVPAPVKFPYDTDGMWEESFGGHTDTKPRGPSAVGVDVSFPGSQHVYGIPEHASDFALKNTDGTNGGYSEPFRLWNLDVFEFDLDVPMALYGAVPFLVSHDEDKTVGALWLNAAETYVDIRSNKDEIGNPSKTSHWLSESGIVDLFLFPGPQPKDVFYQYNQLTGFASLPPLFSVAYHQCRWNYKSQDDVAQVDRGFDEHDIPYDVLWLDIEHTDGKKYFTWDKSNFPQPEQMQKALSAKGRKMVTIVDPHMKRDSSYKVHTTAQNDGYYVKNSAAKGGDYEGWCWPGSVSYLDFLRSDVRNFWHKQFSLSSYEHSTKDLFIWNDMNEPSVFNGPEVTMPKDCLHDGGKFEHRDVHNQYGFYYHKATFEGLEKRVPGERAFVLTRSFFAGSQKYGAVWTGDNMATWAHLESASPMLLSLNVGGITFSGADVGGFFGNPDAELLTRWYQAAAFQPFFRGHAHIDTKRREPWLMGEPYTAHIRTAIRQRYAYLPYIYTAFKLASVTGFPVLRPLWSEFPRDPETFAIQNSYMTGSALLIHPVSSPNQQSAQVYLPGSEPWYDVTTLKTYAGSRTYSIDTPLSRIPVLQRGGSVVAKRERARRNSAAMARDPFTIVVALDSKASAVGSLYLDDGHSMAHLSGAFIYREFSFADNTLSSKAAPLPSASSSSSPSSKSSEVVSSSSSKYQPDETVTVERVVVWGVKQKYTKAVLRVQGQADVELTFSQTPEQLIVRKPNVHITHDFSIVFS